MISLLRHLLEENKENLSFDLEIEDKLIISCDKYYITRTIDNIIINAIQYCPQGKITIILHKNQQAEVELNIKDEGIGIPKNELFDVFGSSESDDYEGED